jgi:hypothetical protein
MSPAEQIALEVLRLVNESPRTPTKAQLTDCISVMLDVVKDDGELAVPPGTTVHPTHPGAYVKLIDLATMTLQVDGWTATSTRPPEMIGRKEDDPLVVAA